MQLRTYVILPLDHSIVPLINFSFCCEAPIKISRYLYKCKKSKEVDQSIETVVVDYLVSVIIVGWLEFCLKHSVSPSCKVGVKYEASKGLVPELDI